MTTIAVVDPSTEEPFAEVPDQGPEDARAAVEAAAAALPDWAATAPRERAEVLRRAHERLLTEADRIAELITRENGKPIAEAKGEVAYSAEFFRWYAEEAVRLDGRVTTAPAGGGRILTILQPVGVSYLISPWNFPAAMLARKWAPALAAGCTTISKPAKLTPLTAIAMTELLIECGAPDGAVQLLTTNDSGAITEAVLADERVRKLSFTGSTEVGRRLIEKSAERIINVSMELGGNAPFVVFAGADLDAAIEGAMVAKLRHNGETCTAANRFYVEASIAGEFAERLTARFAALTLGPGIDPATELGPLVDGPSREKVEALVQAGVDAGARVATGGRRPAALTKGYFYEPTVLTGVEPGSPVVAEEIFGPVAPIVPFTSEDEAVKWANDTVHGLVGYVYTGDLRQGLRVSEALEFGMIGLNKGVVSDPAAPFGGVKQSGIGREGGHEGVLAFCEQKYIATSW
jgi:succinate-semialdehyde dehydrogenase / glutarate-semialdehyde dehydrogenase